jgi:hypothetical protein
MRLRWRHWARRSSFHRSRSSPKAQSSQALVGTWSATVNWNLPSGQIIIYPIAPLI